MPAEDISCTPDWVSGGEEGGVATGSVVGGVGVLGIGRVEGGLSARENEMRWWAGGLA